MLSDLNTFMSFDAPHVTRVRGACSYSRGSKGNFACSSGNITTSCLHNSSLLTLDLSKVQRRYFNVTFNCTYYI